MKFIVVLQLSPAVIKESSDKTKNGIPPDAAKVIILRYTSDF